MNTPASPPPSDELDEILDKVCYWGIELGFSKGLDLGFPEYIKEEHLTSTDAKAAINAYILAEFLELIGEDEPEISSVSVLVPHSRNQLKIELRARAIARFGAA